jgi:hypothetical protein
MATMEMLLERGMTHEQARQFLEDDVFGQKWVSMGRPRDAQGRPVEQGIPLNEFHSAALNAAKRRGQE